MQQVANKENFKICLVGSSGGHLTHLYMLKPFWKEKNRFWVIYYVGHGFKVDGDNILAPIELDIQTESFIAYTWSNGKDW